MALWIHVDKLRTPDFAYGLSMSEAGFGLLTCCTDDPKMACVCHLSSISKTLHSKRYTSSHCKFTL